MMHIRSVKKKYVAGALAAGLVMGAGGIAAAYFSATGSGSGAASVGHATPFSVTEASATGELYPGQHETLSFNIRNTGKGIQHYSIDASQVALAKTGTDIITAKTGAKITGCKVSWFTTSIVGGTQAGTLTPGHTAGFTVTVAMNNGTGSGATQDACQTAHPSVTVAFSGPVQGFTLFGQHGGSATWTTADKAAVLSLSAPSQTTEAAGIQVLNPSTAIPATAPKFETSTYNAGSPRWVILFTTGGHAFGYPSTAGTGVATLWTISGVSGYHPYGTVTSHFSGKHVTQAFIVMDTDQAPPSTAKITTVTYGGQKF